MPAMRAVMGMVSTHVIRTFWTKPQRTIDMRSAAPAPIIDMLVTWVALTLAPNKAVQMMMSVDDTSALNPCMGRT